MSRRKNIECTLCTEKKIANDIIICPHCSVEICEPCFQYGLTMDLQDPICIYCKKGLNIEFILANNDTLWCKKVFLDYYSNLLLEKEKNKLMDSVPKFRMVLELRSLKKEVNSLLTNKKIETSVKQLKLEKKEFDKKSKELIFERNKKKYDLNEQIKVLENKIYDSRINKKKETENKISYITKCPIESCKGFINNKYTCEMCDISLCKACLMIRETDHTCIRENIESAEMIMKDSKPCPNCYIPIFKLSGCNQMFCTNCHVVFDWISLKIDKGPVHNQHFFDYLAKMNNVGDQARLENNACGHIRELYPRISFYTRNSWIHHLFLLNQEIEADLINEYKGLIKDNFEDYRIKYLCDEINEKSWKIRIMNDTIHNESIRSYIEIFEMFLTVSSDIIRRICYEYDELLAKKRRTIKQIIKDVFENLDLYNKLNEQIILDKLVISFNNYIYQLTKNDAIILIDAYLENKESFFSNDFEIFNELNINIFYSKEIFENINSKYKIIKQEFINHFKKDLNDTYQTFGKDLNKNAYAILHRHLYTDF